MALDEEETAVKDAHPMCIHTMSAIIPPHLPIRGAHIEALRWGKYGPLLLKSLNYQKLCTFEN